MTPTSAWPVSSGICTVSATRWRAQPTPCPRARGGCQRLLSASWSLSWCEVSRCYRPDSCAGPCDSLGVDGMLPAPAGRSRPGSWTWRTTRSACRRGCIRKLRRSGSCGTHSPSCGRPASRSAPIAATGLCCRRSARGPAATRRATRSSSSAPPAGCGGSSVRSRAGRSPTLTRHSRSLGSRPRCPATRP